MKSYLTRVGDKKIRNAVLHWKQGLLCDKPIYHRIAPICNCVLAKKYLSLFQTSNLKEVADDNLKFEESGVKFSKMVENTVGGGEIARYE